MKCRDTESHVVIPTDILSARRRLEDFANFRPLSLLFAGICCMLQCKRVLTTALSSATILAQQLGADVLLAFNAPTKSPQYASQDEAASEDSCDG